MGYVLDLYTRANSTFAVTFVGISDKKVLFPLPRYGHESPLGVTVVYRVQHAPR